MLSWGITEKIYQRMLLDAQCLHGYTHAARVRANLNANGVKWKLINVLVYMNRLNQVLIRRWKPLKEGYPK